MRENRIEISSTYCNFPYSTAAIMPEEVPVEGKTRSPMSRDFELHLINRRRYSRSSRLAQVTIGRRRLGKESPDSHDDPTPAVSCRAVEIVELMKKRAPERKQQAIAALKKTKQLQIGRYCDRKNQCQRPPRRGAYQTSDNGQGAPRGRKTRLISSRVCSI
jgi:hypothetical protein